MPRRIDSDASPLWLDDDPPKREERQHDPASRVACALEHRQAFGRLPTSPPTAVRSRAEPGGRQRGAAWATWTSTAEKAATAPRRMTARLESRSQSSRECSDSDPGGAPASGGEAAIWTAHRQTCWTQANATATAPRFERLVAIRHQPAIAAPLQSGHTRQPMCTLHIY